MTWTFTPSDEDVGELGGDEPAAEDDHLLRSFSAA